MVFPPHYPRAMAASFPEGSIKPCRRSITVQTSEYASFAEVPCILEAFSLIITFSFLIFKLKLSEIKIIK